MPTLVKLFASHRVGVICTDPDVLAADVSGTQHTDLSVTGNAEIDADTVDGFSMGASGLSASLAILGSSVKMTSARLNNGVIASITGNNHLLELHYSPAGATNAVITAEDMFSSRIKLHVTNSTVHTNDYFFDLTDCDDNEIEIDTYPSTAESQSWSSKHLIRLTDCNRNKVSVRASYINFVTNNAHDFITLAGTSTANSIMGCKFNRISGSGNRPRHAVNIGSSCVRTRVVGNDFGASAAYVGAVINDTGTDTIIFWPSDIDVGDNIIDELAGSGPGGSGGGIGVNQITTLSKSGELELYTGLHLLAWPFDVEIVSIRATSRPGPTGDDLIIDALVNDVSIYPTTANPQVTDGAEIGAKVVPDNPDVPEDDFLRIDIIQVGITTPGENLTTIVEWRRTA